MLLCRQFEDMEKSKLEGLINSFPKLVPSGTQHTMVETGDVRFVYQTMEDIYLVLTTSLNSNILQDMETLTLFSRAVAETCGKIDEKLVSQYSFELIYAFDEIVSLGIVQTVSLVQLRTIMAMESSEEKVQELIRKNKELEAKEQMKIRAKQLEMDKKLPFDGFQPSHYVPRSPSPELMSPITTTGMKLTKEVKQEFMDSFHISIDEKIIAVMSRDGALESVELKGDLSVHVKSPTDALIRLSDVNHNVFKIHPSFDKTKWKESLLYRDKKYMPGPTPALKWRIPSILESQLPISINCWPTPSSNNMFDVTIELDPINDLDFQQIVTKISTTSIPQIKKADGTAEYQVDGKVHWFLDKLEETASIEFSAQADSPSQFFPIKVSFSCKKTLTPINVIEVENVANYGLSVSCTGEYTVN